MFCPQCGKPIDPQARFCSACGAPSAAATVAAASAQPAAPKSGMPGMVIALIVGVCLLVVLGFIGILAAIAVPNFLEAQTRAKVSRAMSDLRTLATALEAYNIDAREYPTELRVLTTPVPYLTRLSDDPFATPGTSYHYYRIAPDRWMVWGNGPSGSPTFYPQELPAALESAPSVETYLLQHRYDPTNGTTSRGEIIRSNLPAMPGR